MSSSIIRRYPKSLTSTTKYLALPMRSSVRCSPLFSNAIQRSLVSSRRCFQTSQPSQLQSTSARRAVHEITSKSEFEKVIKDQVSPSGTAHKGQVIFIDAFATWCGPCKAVAPIVHRWSEDPQEGLKDRVAFYKFDVDKVPQLAQELGIRAMPTFLIFKAGESTPAEEIVGASPPLMKKGIEKVLGMQ